MTFDGHNFNKFPENQLIKCRAFNFRQGNYTDWK